MSNFLAPKSNTQTVEAERGNLNPEVLQQVEALDEADTEAKVPKIPTVMRSFAVDNPLNGDKPKALIGSGGRAVRRSKRILLVFGAISAAIVITAIILL